MRYVPSLQWQGDVVVDFRGRLRAAQQGDEDAFAAIWREFQPGLLRYLFVKASPVAEDLAADTWIRVLRALPSFEGDENGFRAWLYTTARNRMIDWFRGAERRVQLIEDSKLAVMPASNSVEADASERSDTDAALKLIGMLPPDQAEAVMLRIVAGLDCAAVATIMNRSAGAVRVLCHRGLRRLESMLEVESADADTDVRLEPEVACVGASPLVSDRVGVGNVQEHQQHG